MQPSTQGESTTATGSPFSGLIKIFFSPGEVFTSAHLLMWLVPFIATAVLALTLNLIVINRVGMGTIVRNQLESNTRLAERLGPDGINQAVRNAEESSGQKTVAFAGAPVAAAIMLFGYAGIAFGCLLISGGRTRWNAVLTACSWSAYAVMLVTAIGTAAVVLMMSDFSGVEVSRLFGLNVGMFLSRDSFSPAVRALAGGIDLIAFWGVYLSALGTAKLSERVSMGQALGVFFVLHVLFTGVRAGWAAMFG